MDRFLSLALFSAAIEEGSLAAAGRRFDLSPAVAGKHVSMLEAQLNVRLLQRTTRRLALTEAGRAFLPRCRRILEEFDEAQREAGDVHQLVRGTLRIAAPTAFGALRMGEVIARYVLEHPSINVELKLDDRYVDLVEQEIDLAVRIGRLTDSGLVTRRLGTCRLMLCASPEFIARHGEPHSPADLRLLPRLCFTESVSAGDWTFTAPDGTVHVIEGTAAVRADNVQVLAAIAASGAGLCYGPDFVFQRALASGALVPLLTDYATPVLDIHAAFPTARRIPEKVRRFVERLAEEIG